MATPEELINEIIANAMEIAEDYTDKVDVAAKQLIAEDGGTYFDLPSTEVGFSPSAIEPSIPVAADTSLSFEANLDKIVALLSGQLADFFNLYYPLASDSFDEAQAWLVNIITNGGRGIDEDLEDQLWQRARDRIITDSGRIEEQIEIGFMAKGYSLPAGAMTKKASEVYLAQLGETGSQSTDIASKQFDTELETIKYAITNAIDSRKMAMDAAADYIKAIATAPSTAVDITSLDTDVQADMMSAAATWYNARLNRDDLILKSSLADLSADMELWKGRKGFAVDAARTNVNALAAAATTYGQSAAAALSSLNSIVTTATNSFS